MRPAELVLRGHLNDLPVLPAVAQHLIASLDDPDVRLDTLAQDLAHDPVLAARVVRAANSAFYAPARPIDSVDGALRYLGFNTVRSIVLTSVLAHAIALPPDIVHPIWRRSLRTAGLALTMAEWIKAPGQAAFLAGLTHDLGGLVLRFAEPDAMQRIDRACAQQGRAAHLATEWETFGTSALGVSAALLRIWAFPEAFATALETDEALSLGQTTSAPLDPLSDPEARLACALHVGRRICDGDMPALPPGTLADYGLSEPDVPQALAAISTDDLEQLAQQ